MASSTVNIRIGHWHKISIFRSKQRGWLSVDGEKAVNVSSPGRMHSIEMPLSLMVGGLPEYKKLSPKVDARRGLIGCIKVIKVGKEAISLTYPSPDSVSGRNVGKNK